MLTWEDALLTSKFTYVDKFKEKINEIEEIQMEK